MRTGTNGSSDDNKRYEEVDSSSLRSGGGSSKINISFCGSCKCGFGGALPGWCCKLHYSKSYKRCFIDEATCKNCCIEEHIDRTNSAPSNC